MKTEDQLAKIKKELIEYLEIQFDAPDGYIFAAQVKKCLSAYDVSKVRYVPLARIESFKAYLGRKLGKYGLLDGSNY